MPDYRRIDCPGATIFFTVVTHNRRPILTDDAIPKFRNAIELEMRFRPFTIDAAVILPDHLHMIWSLPPDDRDFSMRWSQIKQRFTRAFVAANGHESNRTKSKENRKEHNVWQRRFWDRVIRDDREFGALVDYIHFNPVKHGHVNCPHQWPHSSFHRWVRAGVYENHWQCGCRSGRPKRFQQPNLEKIVGE